MTDKEDSGEYLVAPGDAFQDARLRHISKLTPDVIEMTVEIGAFSFVPGQYVVLKLQDENGFFFRAFSIVDYRDGNLIFCIRVYPDSRVSEAIMYLLMHDLIGVSDAKGGFVLRGSNKQPKLFAAMGTGIAPILPMLKRVSTAQCRLLLGVRDERQKLYERQLSSIPNLSFDYVMSQPSQGWEGLTGYVTDHLAVDQLAPDTEVYLCGAEEMVEHAVAVLVNGGYPRGLIVTEVYSSATEAVS
jgi:NAD(P)H-flavin reductase